jgi:hypothetical protein
MLPKKGYLGFKMYFVQSRIILMYCPIQQLRFSLEKAFSQCLTSQINRIFCTFSEMDFGPFYPVYDS